MKKLILMLLVLVGGVQMKAANHTIYLIPGEWDNADQTEVFAAWVCEGTGLTDKWVKFTDSGLGFYTASFEDGYTKIVLGRFNTGVEIKWDNQWNKSTDISFDSTTPVYTFSSWGDNNPDNFTATALYKLYVKNMESDANVNFDSWERGNDYFVWPGESLAKETVGSEEWNVFYWPLNSVKGDFTLNDTEEDHHTSGGQTFDLSTVKYYNYYPSFHEHVLASEALAEPATIHFRTNAEEFDPTKCYFWNCDGISTKFCFSNQTVNGYVWKTITTHKPSFNIQFYGGDGGEQETDPSTITCTSDENAFYVFRLNWGGNSKYDSKYYFISTDNADGGNNYLVKQEMEQQTDPFVFKTTLDNITDTKSHFFEIAPSSALNNNLTPADYANLIYSTNWDYEGKQPYVCAGWAEYSTATMIGRTNGYNRWKISEAYKYEIIYNFATAKVTVHPYFTRTIVNNNDDENEGYATFSSDYNVTIPEGVTAFYASANDDNKVTMTKITGTSIGEGDGVFLAAAPGTYNFTPAAATDVIEGNLLKKPTGADGNTVPVGGYVLAKQNDNLGFYKVTTQLTNQKGKAYLELPSSSPMFSFDFGEGTTGINDVRSQMEEAREGIFDLQGRRVENPTKGLYIVNGKKVFIK